jgi:hypothetical protein
MVRNGDYTANRDLFTRLQDLYEAVFGRTFSRQPDAMCAFLKIAGPESEDVFRRAGKDLTHVLTTVVLEILGEEEIETLMKEIVDRAKAAAPPAAPGSKRQRRATAPSQVAK